MRLEDGAKGWEEFIDVFEQFAKHAGTVKDAIVGTGLANGIVDESNTLSFLFTKSKRVFVTLPFADDAGQVGWTDPPVRLEVSVYLIVLVWKLDIVLLDVFPPIHSSDMND